MRERFFLADTHFGHKNIHKFRLKADGSAFESAEIHDEFVMDMWNTYIPGGCDVYCLGDIAFNTKGLEKLRKLSGHKHLIAGNHDPSLQTCVHYFASIHAMKAINVAGFKTITTHIPLHPASVDERYNLNIHGHLHHNDLHDPRYKNVSLEAIGFVPITFDEIIAEAING